MKFEPGEKYVWMNEKLVTYIGLCADKEYAVVEDEDDDLHFVMFDALKPQQKKVDLWVCEQASNDSYEIFREIYDSKDKATLAADLAFTNSNVKATRVYQVQSVKELQTAAP